jgi:hypothetical protein
MKEAMTPQELIDHMYIEFNHIRDDKENIRLMKLEMIRLKKNYDINK